MIKILFVCHGNICRSPMAEFIMKDLVKREGLKDEFYIESAATSTETIYRGHGSPVYEPAQDELLKHGIFCDGKYSRQVTKEDYKNFDYIVVMDDNNLRNIAPIIGADTDGKVRKLLSFASIDRDVFDPWYTRDFRTCYEDILTGCQAMLMYFKDNR